MSRLSEFAGAGPLGKAPMVSGCLQGAQNYLFYGGSWMPGAYHSQGGADVWADAVNYSGSGVLEFCAHANTANGSNSTMEIIIDGVTVYSGSTGATDYYGCVPVGGAAYYNGANVQYVALSRIPFHTSLQVRHKSSNGYASWVNCKYWKTR